MNKIQKKKQLKKGVQIYSITVILIIIVAIIRYFYMYDIMSFEFFTCKWFGELFDEQGIFSMWPLSHIILYVFLGYFSPQYWWLWSIIGIIWEIIEYIGGTCLYNTCENTGKIGNTGNKLKKAFIGEKNTQYKDKWITGVKSDIFFNSLGLIIGIIIGLTIAKLENDKTPSNISSPSYTLTYRI